MYIHLYTVYSVHCIVYSVYCIVYSVHCTLYTDVVKEQLLSTLGIAMQLYKQISPVLRFDITFDWQLIATCSYMAIAQAGKHRYAT